MHQWQCQIFGKQETNFFLNQVPLPVPLLSSAAFLSPSLPLSSLPFPVGGAEQQPEPGVSGVGRRGSQGPSWAKRPSVQEGSPAQVVRALRGEDDLHEGELGGGSVGTLLM